MCNRFRLPAIEVCSRMETCINTLTLELAHPMYVCVIVQGSWNKSNSASRRLHSTNFTVPSQGLPCMVLRNSLTACTHSFHVITRWQLRRQMQTNFFLGFGLDCCSSKADCDDCVLGPIGDKPFNQPRSVLPLQLGKAWDRTKQGWPWAWIAN